MSIILVVDDSATDRRLVGGILAKDETLRVDFAEHGAAALARMRIACPDLVVTDLMMPEMDGLELVANIRAKFPFVPTVLMTSKGSEDIAVQALQNGAASYVPKRALAQDLLETVHNVLELTRRQRNQEKLMAALVRNKCRFVLGTDRALLSSLVGYFQETTAYMGLCDESDRMRIGIALEEALVNAFYHGNLEVSSELRERDHNAYQALIDQRCLEEPYRSRRITIDAELSYERATFVIRDQGRGFDPSTLPDPTDPANLERVSGRGVLLMRTFMDEVTYNDQGNEVTLVKVRRAAEEDE